MACYIVWQISWHEKYGKADLLDRDRLSKRFAIHYEHRRSRFYNMAGPLLVLTFARGMIVGTADVSTRLCYTVKFLNILL